MRKTDTDILEFLANTPNATYSQLKSFMGVTSNQTVSDRLHRMQKDKLIHIGRGKGNITVLHKPKYWVLQPCGHLQETSTKPFLMPMNGGTS